MRLIACIAVVALFTGLLVSCGPPPEQLPERVKVTGKVQYSTGQALTGGTVSFQDASSPFSVTGPIEPDGSFRLYTLGTRAKEEGAPPGKYQVTVVPPLQNQDTQPVTLPKALEIKPGVDNTFTLTIPRK
jgi:hypothetical protein